MSPRVPGAVFHHPGCAPRAATTASRASLREARAMFAPNSLPSHSGSLRPDSERTKAPLIKSLYILRTASRTSPFLDMGENRYDAREAPPSGEPAASMVTPASLVASSSPSRLTNAVLPFCAKPAQRSFRWSAGLREALHEALRDARGLIVRSETRVDAQLLAAAPHLEVVARAGVGVDAIDVDAATAAGIVVVNTPSANTLAATEQTFALLLAAMRNVPQAQRERACRSTGSANRSSGTSCTARRWASSGSAASGATSRRVRAAFGMHVIAHDPYLAASRARALGVELVSFDELARTRATSSRCTYRSPRKRAA